MEGGWELMRYPFSLYDVCSVSWVFEDKDTLYSDLVQHSIIHSRIMMNRQF